MNYYTTIKALHIIFVVSWFAGLFYIVRLFIYHTEAQIKESNAKEILSEQFCIMEKKLWWIITTPAMVLTLFFGIWMLCLNPSLFKAPWMHLKLGFVALLLVYHFVCQRIMFQLVQNIYRWKSNSLRIWNELATLCLVAIVFLVVMKNELNWIWGTIGFFAVAIGLMLAIQLYKKLRNR
jgi:protoporphyrinogen IX oxidase